MHSFTCSLQQLLHGYCGGRLPTKREKKEREREREQSPRELVKSESYRYVGMIKRPANNVKLIIKGPWADTSLQALLNTYKGELLHSLSRGYLRENEANRNSVVQAKEEKKGECTASGKRRHHIQS